MLDSERGGGRIALLFLTVQQMSVRFSNLANTARQGLLPLAGF